MALKTGHWLPHSTLRRVTLLVIVLATVIILLTNIGLDYVRHVFPQSVTSFSASCQAEVTAPPIVLVDAVFPVKIQVLRGNIKYIPRSNATVRFSPGNTAHVQTVTLYYGVGTTNLTISKAGVLQLSVTVETTGDHAPTETCQASVRIKAAHLSDREVGYRLIRKGTLEGDALEWSAGFVLVEGPVTVPKSATLVVDPGVFTLLHSGASINVLGKAAIGAPAGQPVVFTVHPNESGERSPWGGLQFGRNSLGALHNTWLTQGGASADQHSRFATSNAGVVLSVEEGAEVDFSGGGVVDNAGPGVRGTRCTIKLKNMTISRCRNGGYVQQATVTMENVYVIEISRNHVASSQPIGDGFAFNQPQQSSADKALSRISNSVFTGGGGVGIAISGTSLNLESTIVEDFSKACVSTSGRVNTVTIHNSIMRSCSVGLRAKDDGKQNVHVTNSVMVQNEVGVWYGDRDAPTSESGTFILKNSVAMENSAKNLRVFSGGLEQPDTDIGARNVKLTCFFVSRGSAVETSRTTFSIKPSASCQQPKIHLAHSGCDFAMDLLPSKCLLSDYTPQGKRTHIQLQRLDLCRDCCKNASSLEFEDNYGPLSMRNIRDMKRATIYTGKPNEGCGVTFSTDLYQHIDSDCIVQKVHVKSAYSDVTHYQGESHLRELKVHYLDRVMHTNLTAKSFGVIVDFSHIPDRSSSALIKSSMSCPYSQRNTPLSAFVTEFLPNIGIYTRMTVKLAELAHPNNFHKYVAFLYIGNCMKSKHSDFVNMDTNNYVLIDNDRCLVPDRVGDGDIPAGYRYRLTRLYEILFTNQHVCQVPDDMITRLKEMNAVSSQAPSLGTQFRKEVESHPAMAPLVLKEDPEIYEELDGRVSILVSEYNAICEGANTDRFDSSLRKVYKTSPITESYLVDGRDYILAKFVDGTVAYLKVVGGEMREDVDGYVVNGGLAELVAYHLDRLLGMGRVAVAAARRLRLDETVPINGVINEKWEVLEDFDGKKDTLGRYLTDAEAKTTSRSIQWIARHLQKSQHEVYHSLDVVVVGKVKSQKENVELHPQVREFFKHSADFVNLENVGVTRQMLRDLANIFVFDFLIHNPSRKKLATSELRFVTDGNDKAFWPDVSIKACDAILKCPALLQPEGTRASTEKHDACPKICPNTDVIPSDQFVNCRFTVQTFSTLKRFNVGKGYDRLLSSKLRQSLMNETIDIDSFKSYFGKANLYEGLGARFFRLTQHMKKCMVRFGNGIFI
ncbi:Hypp1767 [Branchiostoma lanceolatum]|uniref:Hypp1767 protein n=1 Tax=Branchiostoma lanceolatum TaxID=7740 RepID=A0A8J9ZMX2_BRALA|nr:Hypp1767 [Branchiostoma lanceolatum]